MFRKPSYKKFKYMFLILVSCFALVVFNQKILRMPEASA